MTVLEKHCCIMLGHSSSTSQDGLSGAMFSPREALMLGLSMYHNSIRNVRHGVVFRSTTSLSSTIKQSNTLCVAVLNQV